MKDSPENLKRLSEVRQRIYTNRIARRAESAAHILAALSVTDQREFVHKEPKLDERDCKQVTARVTARDLRQDLARKLDVGACV